jgi:iron-sulfur cluster repair protein YtfE (RIC family)
MASNRISQVLHEEHVTALALMGRLEAFLGRHGTACPDARAAEAAGLLRGLGRALNEELPHHFGFEEAELFPRLAAAGDGALGAHLTEDHERMYPAIRELAELTADASAAGFTAEGWALFRRAAATLCRELPAHIEKEEASLGPAVEETLDVDTDARLYAEYVGNA